MGRHNFENAQNKGILGHIGAGMETTPHFGPKSEQVLNAQGQSRREP